MDREGDSAIKTALVKTGHTLLQLGIVRLAVRFFPGLTGFLTPAVSVAYERVRKNTDLPGVVDQATAKLKNIQNERSVETTAEHKDSTHH